MFLVEDSDLMRELVADFVEAQPDLTLCGAAASGEEALGLIPVSACDVALVDVRMPGMNGIELVRHLRSAAPGLPCIMVTAHAEAVYADLAREAGARDFVAKGDPAALLAAIRRVLDEPPPGGHTPQAPRPPGPAPQPEARARPPGRRGPAPPGGLTGARSPPASTPQGQARWPGSVSRTRKAGS